MMITAALALACFYYYRRTVQRVFHKQVEDAMQKDLKDPIETYRLLYSNDLLCFVPTGPSGFWIAEDRGEVIGFVALSNSIIRIAEGLLTFRF